MEKKLIAWLREEFGNDTAGSDFVRVGIGDDCAVLQATDGELVLTCDAICEGVHFDSQQMTPIQIGRKALAVNLSDLASMGAVAKTALVSLTLPRNVSFSYVQELFRGLRPLADRYDVGICGGDTTVWDGPLVVSITAIGVAPKTGAWMMDGALLGDHVVVTGSFGGSILKEHWAFEPSLDFAKRWRNEKHQIHACTDASDSLGIDLQNLADASGVGFEIDLNKIPVSPDAEKLAETSGSSALHHALTDGEDFQLVMAVAAESVDDLIKRSETKLTSIGRFTQELDYVAIDGDQRVEFKPVGYEHQLGSERREAEENK